MNPPDLLPSLPQMLLGLYGFLLPVLLYVLWSTLALWDLGNRADLGRGAVWGWTLAIFLVPFAGPAAYLIASGKRIPSRVRLAAVGGGAGLYGVVLLLGVWSGVG